MINPTVVGKFIAQKRKEKNLTQENLAERIGVSNKSISKWERGKCMPDYSIIESLCKELGITISELLDGEENENNSLRTYDDQQTLEMLARIQHLERQRQTFIGVILIVMGIALQALSQNTGGTSFNDFVSGLMLGISVGIILTGLYIAGRSLIRNETM